MEATLLCPHDQTLCKMHLVQCQTRTDAFSGCVMGSLHWVPTGPAKYPACPVSHPSCPILWLLHPTAAGFLSCSLTPPLGPPAPCSPNGGLHIYNISII